MDSPPRKSFKRLLIANRGEIANRIIATARELDLETYAIYVSGDSSHATKATHAIEVPSAATFMSISALVDIAKNHNIEAVHPGYGFLSESADFAKTMWHEARAVVVGPGWTLLEETGDKLKAKLLAEKCQVPTCPALKVPTNDIEKVREFASKSGYPIMVKAVDGGGGRGIRLIRGDNELDSSVKRAIEESPSRQVFAERAALIGFRHIEVQVIGDGHGNVAHLWERECSIQRRYQKVVEIAPSTISDRKLIAKVIDSALRIARSVRYLSLGTFEFLVNSETNEYYFLEINPRLQVEHTITESISGTDIVKAQILLAQGADVGAFTSQYDSRNPERPPPVHSIQLRITAENVHNDWSLSIGKITSFQFPAGNGIRVDTHLINGHPTIISTDFDSLIAKVIVTASSWKDVVKKAYRALEDTRIEGVQTNLDILRGIVTHPDFIEGKCDTLWLEKKQKELLGIGERIGALSREQLVPGISNSFSALTSSAGNLLFRKGDAWSVTLSDQTASEHQTSPHHLEISRILRNEFPKSLSAEILLTQSSTNSEESRRPIPFTLTFDSTSASASATTSHHKRGNPSNPSHIIIPFTGKLIEVLVEENERVKQDDVICVVQQMKMELEVRSPRNGKVTWLMDVEDGEQVEEGFLAATVEVEKEARL